MALYFVQHGVALSKEQDPDRPLSSEGEADVIGVAQRLKTQQIRPSTICHSGKKRASQTAEIFAGQLFVSDVHAYTGMGPNDDVRDFTKGLTNDGTMFIGHLPHLAKVVSFLVAGDENSAVVKFTNAAVVCLEQDDSDFYIDWMIKPSLC
jgi:phosphohistidine phosphatase